ncbi:hypothetical protein V1512DRAFT_239819 [Lipomyces arxii]|uniref:uncharacterized protein n=1 Tax=Lipomyces arxii TaxID=56418 RepID=UPI0034CD2E91
MTSVYTLTWGIVGTGWISERFYKDLLIDPNTRDVSDVAHKPVAVASRSIEKAADFIKKFTESDEVAATVKPYGSYSELMADPAVDCVYVGTPHDSHYEYTLMALRAGKHVLCEKPFTINAAQAIHLKAVAAEKKRFLMEAVWTRFFPLTIAMEKMIHEDQIIGPIRRVFTDLAQITPKDPSHRLNNPAAGGGALLDLGVYSTTWMLSTCYHHPKNEMEKPTSIKANMIKSEMTGVDESTVVTMTWPKVGILGVSSCSLMVSSPYESVIRVQGDKGDMIVPIHSSRPEKLVVHLYTSKPYEYEEKVFEFPIPGWGLFWEADAVARDIRDGKLENERYSLDESILAMSIFDEARQQNDLVYPASIEAVEA